MSDPDDNIPYRPGLEKVPAAISTICFLDGDVGRLEYRGYSIEDLAARCTFEETAYLLLFGELPNSAELTAFSEELERESRLPSEVLGVLNALPPTGHPMLALEAGCVALGMMRSGVHYHGADPEAPENRRREAIRLIAAFPAIVAAWHRIRSGRGITPHRPGLSHAARFLHLLTGQVPVPAIEKVFDACLVLHAEHEMNASTFTARVVASSLPDPGSAMAAAVGSLSGPLHGGANERVLDMLREIGAPDNVEPWLEKTLAAKGVIWGVGHREYRVKDPRAVILQALNVEIFRTLGPTPLYDTAVRLEEVLAKHPKFGAAPTQRAQKFPNVDFYSGIVYEKMGIPTDVFTPIFAISRIAGWLAHYLEQTSPGHNKIFRPKQIYEGSPPRKIDRISERR